MKILIYQLLGPADDPHLEKRIVFDDEAQLIIFNHGGPMNGGWQLLVTPPVQLEGDRYPKRRTILRNDANFFDLGATEEGALFFKYYNAVFPLPTDPEPKWPEPVLSPRPYTVEEFQQLEAAQQREKDNPPPGRK